MMPKYPQSASIRRIFTQGQPLSVGKGEVILGNDPEPNGVYYLSSGYVKVYSLSDEGQENMHLIYGPGELFPLIWAYLGTQPQLLFFETISEVSMWRISREWFSKFVTTNLELSYSLGRQVAEQFRIYSDRVDNLEYKKANERIAYRLLFLAGRFGRHQGDSIIIDAPLTHEIFANSINLARESVSREIEKLEKMGLVKNHNHHIEILDVNALAATLTRPINLDNWYL